MMSIDYELEEEFKQRLIDRYTAGELVDLLDIAIEDVLEAFEPRWSGNRFLLTEVGMLQEEDE